MNKPFLIQALVGPKQKAGVGRYLEGYLKEWSKSAKEDFVCLEASVSNELDYKKIQVWLSGNGLIDTLLYQFYNWYYQKNAHKLGLRGVFIPNLRFVFVSRVPIVITIHDMAEFDTDTYTGLRKAVRRWMVKRAVKYASLIITVSEFSKERLIHHLKLEPEKIKVIYPGVDVLNISAADDELNKELSSSAYYLYVGRFSKNKGFEDIVALYQKYKANLLPIYVIGPDSKEKKKYGSLIKALKLQENILLLPYVSDSVLKRYILNCKKLVFPSRYEGFGFPVLEALKNRKQVVVCFNRATYEIIGDACAFYKAGDIDSLFALLNKMDNSRAIALIACRDNLSLEYSASNLQHVLNQAFKAII